MHNSKFEIVTVSSNIVLLISKFKSKIRKYAFHSSSRNARYPSGGAALFSYLSKTLDTKNMQLKIVFQEQFIFDLL